jgi:hypothetical protein
VIRGAFIEEGGGVPHDQGTDPDIKMTPPVGMATLFPSHVKHIRKYQYK